MFSRPRALSGLTERDEGDGRDRAEAEEEEPQRRGDLLLLDGGHEEPGKTDDVDGGNTNVFYYNCPRLPESQPPAPQILNWSALLPSDSLTLKYCAVVVLIVFCIVLKTAFPKLWSNAAHHVNKVTPAQPTPLGISDTVGKKVAIAKDADELTEEDLRNGIESLDFDDGDSDAEKPGVSPARQNMPPGGTLTDAPKKPSRAVLDQQRQQLEERIAAAQSFLDDLQHEEKATLAQSVLDGARFRDEPWLTGLGRAVIPDFTAVAKDLGLMQKEAESDEEYIRKYKEIPSRVARLRLLLK